VDDTGYHAVLTTARVVQHGVCRVHAAQIRHAQDGLEVYKQCATLVDFILGMSRWNSDLIRRSQPRRELDEQVSINAFICVEEYIVH
jgi:hypothetical protein